MGGHINQNEKDNNYNTCDSADADLHIRTFFVQKER
jgi:hypothetical protein